MHASSYAAQGNYVNHQDKLIGKSILCSYNIHWSGFTSDQKLWRPRENHDTCSTLIHMITTLGLNWVACITIELILYIVKRVGLFIESFMCLGNFGIVKLGFDSWKLWDSETRSLILMNHAMASSRALDLYRAFLTCNCFIDIQHLELPLTSIPNC